MATSPEKARTMIAACKAANRLLMIAYRCQYETYNADLARRARAGELGQIRLIDAVNVQNQGDPAQWRQIKALAGGGALPDIGLCGARGGDPRFRQVEASMAFTLRFPSGALATCSTSYAAHERRDFHVYGSEAAAAIENAFSYEGQRLTIARRDGKAEAIATIAPPQRNQFALELGHMAECVRSAIRPRTPGEEGLHDQLLMAALYESASNRRPVTFPAMDGRDRYRGPLPQSGG